MISKIDRIIPITDEMKQSCPSLKGYTDIIIMNNEYGWHSANVWADEFGYTIPDKDTLKYICSVIGLDEVGRLYWSSTISKNDSNCAYAVRSDYMTWFDMDYKFGVVCLGDINV